jgi:hypothetical protein
MAGIRGAHHAWTPRADTEASPSNLMLTIMTLAQASALIKLRLENRKGVTPAYAHANGIAIRSPGKNRRPNISFMP